MSTRLFVALEPPDECRELVAAARESLGRRFPELQIRWQPDANLHLTLAFLGNVSGDVAEDCRARLATCTRRSGPFDLTTRRLGAFPSATRPSVIWLGVEADPAAALARLQHDVADCYRHVRDEGRPFKPHVTLGRVKRMDGVDRGALAAALAEHPHGSVTWRVTSVVLFESVLTADGAIHLPSRTVDIAA